MGISEEAMVMRCILAAVLVASVLGANPEEELDKLALHVEHYPHAQGSNHAIYQFQIDNNNENDKTTDPVDFTAEVSPGTSHPTPLSTSAPVQCECITAFYGLVRVS